MKSIILSILLISLITNVLTANYAIDCNLSNKPGFVDLPDFNGINGENTIFVDFNLKTSTSAGGLFSLTNAKGGDEISLYVTNNRLILNAIDFGAIPNLVIDTWYRVGLSFTAGTVTAYVNGVQLGLQTNFVVNNVVRTGLICRTFNGFIDNFGVHSTPLSGTDITNYPTNTPLDATVQDKMILLFTFNEGFGAATTAITPENGIYAVWLGASLNETFFSTATYTGQMRCYVSGDPHIYQYGGYGHPTPLDPNTIGVEWAPENYYLSGTYRYTSCGDFEIRAYIKVVSPWWPSVNRIFIVKAYDEFYMVNAGEFLARGAYRKTGFDGTWIAITDGSGMDRNGVYYSVSYGSISLNIPRVGSVDISSYFYAYLNADIKIDRSNCPVSNRLPGLCDRVKVDGLNYDFNELQYGADPSDPVPVINTDPCDNNPTLKSVAEFTCERFFPSRIAGFGGCVIDICANGDPDSYTDVIPLRECQINDTINAQNGATSTSCPNCPNDCSGHGTCNALTKVCSCVAGYTGTDCGQLEIYDCPLLKRTNTDDGIKISPYNMYVNDNINTIAPMFAMEDTLSFTFTKQSTATNPIRGLLIIADSKKSNDGGSVEVTLQFNGDISTIVVSNAMNTIDTVNRNIKLTLQWANFNYAYAHLTNIPTGVTMTHTFTSLLGISQVVYGSGTLRKELDIIKIKSSDYNTMSVNYNLCNSSLCANIQNRATSCSVCANLAQCGYCITNARCMPGTNSGPDYGTCQDWRFAVSDNTVSRRVTSVISFPVTPVSSEIILTSSVTNNVNADVAIDVRVTTGNTHNVFDVVIAFDPDADDDIIQTLNMLPKLLPSLQNDLIYPDLRLGFVKLGSNPSIMQDLISVSSDNLYRFERALSNFRGVSTGLDQQLAGISSIADVSSPISWRINARRVVISFTSRDYSSNTNINSLKNVLLNNRVVPVFAVNNRYINNLLSTYQNLIQNFNSLGFGLAMNTKGDSSDLSEVVLKSLRLIQGQLSLAISDVANSHVDQSQLGNSETLVINGLTSSMRARFSVPFIKSSNLDNSLKTSYLDIIGYGRSTVEEIASDGPTTSDFLNYVDEDSEIQIYLKGKSHRNLIAVNPVIKSLPLKGMIYDIDLSTGALTQITTVPYPVYNPKSVVVFKSSLNDYSDPSTAPYTSFTFTVSDGCQESSIQTSTIVVNPVNDPPTIDQNSIITDEDKAVNFTITYVDVDNIPTPDLVSISFTSLPVGGVISHNGANVVIGNEYPSSKSVIRSLDFTYTPSNNFNTFENPTEYFTVVATDKQSATGTIMSSITVNPVNDPPTSSYGYPVIVSEDVPSAITISGLDIDKGDLLRITLKNLNTTAKFYLTCTGNTSNTCSNQITEGQSINVTPTSSSPYDLTIYYIGFANYFTCNYGDKVTPSVQTCPKSDSFTFTVYDVNATFSMDTNVDVFIFNVNDPPVANSGNVNFTEDGSFNVSLGASDIEGNTLTYFITSFPSSLQIFDKSGLNLINNTTGLVDGSNVIIKGLKDAFGNPNSNWDYSSFTFQVSDGNLTSNIATISVKITPVNDAPVPTLITTSNMEDVTNSFSLSATDVDNNATDLVFIITSLPVRGSLTRITGPTTEPVRINQVLGTLTLRYRPVPNWFGSVTFNYTVKDKVTYASSFPNDVAYTVSTTATIRVIPVNDQPYANTPAQTAFEDSINIISITGKDEEYENDTLLAEITNTVSSSDGCESGKFYQYNSVYTTVSQYNTVGTLIVNGDSIPSGKVVYIAPENAYTQTSGKYLSVNPFFSYKMKETSSVDQPKLLESSVQTVTLRVESVNDAPTIPNTVNTTLATCYDNCLIEEDLSQHWSKYESTTPLNIFVGYDDVDRDDVTVLITNVDCPTTTSLKTNAGVNIPKNISALAPFVLGTYSLQSPASCGQLSSGPAVTSAIQLIPGLDDINKNLTNYYCKITYRLRDSRSALSVESKVITISINPINDVPRPSERITALVVPDNATTLFEIAIKDPENDPFKIKFTSCGNDNNGLISIKNKQGVYTPLVCNVELDPLLFTKPNGQTVYQFSFTVPKLLLSSFDYRKLTYILIDGLSNITEIDTNSINIDALLVNGPIFLRVNGLSNLNEVSGNTLYASIQLSAYDINLSNSSRDLIEYNITVKNGLVGIYNATIETSFASMIVKVPYISANETLGNFRIYSVADPGDATTVTVVLSDLGSTGLCLNGLIFCPFNDTKIFNATFTEPPNPIVTPIAGAAAAAGAIGAAAAAAALYNLFANKATEEASLWDADDSSSAVDNPLYNDAGKSGQNPIFEGN